MVLGISFINSSNLLTFGGLAYTIATLLKKANIAKYAGYGIMAGAVLWILDQVGINF